MKRSRTSGWLFLLPPLFFLLFFLLLLFLSDRWLTRLQISISVKVSGSWLDSDRVQMARSDESRRMRRDGFLTVSHTVTCM